MNKYPRQRRVPDSSRSSCCYRFTGAGIAAGSEAVTICVLIPFVLLAFQAYHNIRDGIVHDDW
jgi:hypothetical protein